ncbi:hypothetical protein T492DRAFT_834727 [Pavlovales sp. CCMP2436]|nr:hypothetical protein T492DRAFT_834727 [Pavlovales sp. CCMP2436]
MANGINRIFPNILEQTRAWDLSETKCDNTWVTQAAGCCTAVLYVAVLFRIRLRVHQRRHTAGPYGSAFSCLWLCALHQSPPRPSKGLAQSAEARCSALGGGASAQSGTARLFLRGAIIVHLQRTRTTEASLIVELPTRRTTEARVQPMATSAIEVGNEPAVEMPKTDPEGKMSMDLPDLSDDAEEEIVVFWLTKRVVRWDPASELRTASRARRICARPGCARPTAMLAYPAGRADTALPARVGCRPLLQGPVLLPSVLPTMERRLRAQPVRSPWFKPKYEVVVLRGLGVDLLYEDKLVSTEDTTDENKDQVLLLFF